MKQQADNVISTQHGIVERKKAVREQRQRRYWKYYTAAVVTVWTVANLLRPGDITRARIIGIVLGGFVIGVLIGYIIKTLYAMQRVVKHRRIVRKRMMR